MGKAKFPDPVLASLPSYRRNWVSLPKKGSEAAKPRNEGSEQETRASYLANKPALPSLSPSLGGSRSPGTWLYALELASGFLFLHSPQGSGLCQKPVLQP